MTHTEKYLNESEILSLGFLGFTLIVTIIQLTLTILGTYLYTFNGRKSNKLTKLIRDILNDEDVDVYLVADTSPNAFYAGGKGLYITTGLIRLLKKEKYVIATLLHEYGHYKERHVHKHLTYFGISNVAIMYAVMWLVTFLNPELGLGRMLLVIFYFLGRNITDTSINVLIGRKYEYVADSYAAKYGYKDEMIKTLKILERYMRNILCSKVSKGDCDAMIEDLHRFDEHPTFSRRVDVLSKAFTSLVNRFGPFKALKSFLKILKVMKVIPNIG